MLESYFRNLYQRTMREAYGLAEKEIVSALQNGGKSVFKLAASFLAGKIIE